MSSLLLTAEGIGSDIPLRSLQFEDDHKTVVATVGEGVWTQGLFKASTDATSFNFEITGGSFPIRGRAGIITSLSFSGDVTSLTINADELTTS